MSGRKSKKCRTMAAAARNKLRGQYGHAMLRDQVRGILDRAGNATVPA